MAITITKMKALLDAYNPALKEAKTEEVVVNIRKDVRLEIEAIIQGQGVPIKIARLNNFMKCFTSFVAYFNDKYKNTHGDIDGNVMRPLLKEIVAIKLANLVVEEVSLDIKEEE